MFVTNWISTTKIQKISEITNFFRHYFLSRTEVVNEKNIRATKKSKGHGNIGFLDKEYRRQYDTSTVQAV